MVVYEWKPLKVYTQNIAEESIADAYQKDVYFRYHRIAV